MKKLLYVFILGLCSCTTKPDNVVIIPEFVDLSHSCIYGYENPRYIYKEDVATLNCHYYYGE